MGIYIKDMAMPKSCRDCRFLDGEADTDYGVCAWCTVDGKARDTYTRQDCPLVEVPAHGRLVDADADMQVIVTMKANRKCSVDFVAPTVIPAEEGET